MMSFIRSVLEDTPRGRRRVLALVAVLGGLLRVLYVVEIHDHPYWRTPLVDAADYHARAMQVARGAGLGPEVYYKAPAYPWLVGQLYRLTGPRLEAAYALQMLGGIAAAMLAALLGWRWLGPTAGLAGGLGTALYAPLPYFENQLLIESPALFFSVLAAFLLFCDLGRDRQAAMAGAPASVSPLGGSWARLTADVAAGTAAGIALQLRPVNVALVAALLLGLLLQRVDWPRRVRRVACVLVPVLLLLMPTLRHNRVATGEIVPISVNGGINFYIGNNPDYDATVAIRPGLRWEELTQRFDSMDDPVQWQRNFYGAAGTWIGAHPGDWAALFFKKGVLFWNRLEIDRNQDSSAMRGDSMVLRAGVLWWVLAPLGLVGLVLLWRQWRRLPLHALFFLQMLGVMAFFVTSRYRLAVVPWLAIAAGFAIRSAVLAARRHERRRLGRLAALLLLALGLVLPDWYGVAEQDFGRPDFDRAEVLARLGDRDGALQAYERAASRHPEDPDVHLRYGEHLLRMGRREAALGEFRRATELAPWSYKPPLALGAALLERGDLDGAWSALEEAERRGDPHGMTLYDMGLVRERQGRYAEALDLFRQSLGRRDTPADMALRRLGIGRALILVGQPEAAEVEFEAASRGGADSTQVATERARARARLRHAGSGQTSLERSPSLDD
jgi:tetratricopeptide (TPR) repeat protein